MFGRYFGAILSYCLAHGIPEVVGVKPPAARPDQLRYRSSSPHGRSRKTKYPPGHVHARTQERIRRLTQLSRGQLRFEPIRAETRRHAEFLDTIERVNALFDTGSAEGNFAA